LVFGKSLLDAATSNDDGVLGVLYAYTDLEILTTPDWSQCHVDPSCSISDYYITISLLLSMTTLHTYSFFLLLLSNQKHVFIYNTQATLQFRLAIVDVIYGGGIRGLHTKTLMVVEVTFNLAVYR
jgi:hypothetical protein